MVQVDNCNVSLPKYSRSYCPSWQTLRTSKKGQPSNLSWIVTWSYEHRSINFWRKQRALKDRCPSRPSVALNWVIQRFLSSNKIGYKVKLCCCPKAVSENVKESFVFWEGMCQIHDFSWSHRVKLSILLIYLLNFKRQATRLQKLVFAVTQFRGSEAID